MDVKDGQTCGTCGLCHAANDKLGTCRMDPPNLMFLPKPANVTTGAGPQMQPTTIYPTVDITDVGCGRHTQRADLRRT